MNEIWQEAKSVHLPVINSNERELRDRQLQLRNLKNFRKLPPDSHCEIIRTVGAKLVHIAYNLDYCENKALNITFNTEMHCKNEPGTNNSDPPYKILFEERCGRLLVAARDIIAGEVLFTDTPGAVAPDTNPKPVCLNCYRRLPMLIYR